MTGSQQQLAYSPREAPFARAVVLRLRLATRNAASV